MSEHSPSPAKTSAEPAGHDDHHDIAAHVKTYITVGAALLVGTVVTVGMYYVHFDSMALTITIAMFIATVKAFLVAGFFMHLISEKKAIYGMLSATAVFFLALGVLTIWSMNDAPLKTEYKTHYVP